MMSCEISNEYSEADLSSAMRKLQTASVDVDVSSELSAIRIRTFQCRMTPAEFRLQLEKSFELCLTSAEVIITSHPFPSLSMCRCWTAITAMKSEI